jgi:hypothetical protein
VKPALRTASGREMLTKTLRSRGLIYEGSGRLTQGGVVLECLVARTASAVLYDESEAVVMQRYVNVLNDFCSLGVISPAQAPQKAKDDADVAEQERRCVALWNAYLSMEWGGSGLGNDAVVEPGSQEVNPGHYACWESDLFLAIRIFAYFNRLAPKTWTWKANHITLVWKHQPQYCQDYLLSRLAEETARLQVEPERHEDLAAFSTALKAALEAYNRVLAYQLSPQLRRPVNNKTGLLSFFRRQEPAAVPSPVELRREYDTRMEELCKVISFV